MEIDDEIRIRVMDALFKKGALSPNLKAIQRYTGYNKNTIRASLDFLKKQGIVEYYHPTVNLRALGFNLLPMAVLQVDVSQKKIVNKVEGKINKDPYIYGARKIISSGNWNILLMHLCRDIESYHKSIEDTYYKDIPKMDRCIRDKMIFYPTGHAWKRDSVSKTAVEILKKEKGIKDR